MTREEAINILKSKMDGSVDTSYEWCETLRMAIEALKEQTTIPMFTESEEAYKAWTGEEMGKTSDEINEMNRDIIKDILKMMPTAYLLEALGVATFEELTEPTDKPHGRLIDADKLKKQLDTVYNEMANERERKGLRLARWFLISAPTVSATKKLNNQIHLCDSCKYNYQNCPSENEDVLFGNGVGNDNICCCAKYLASADRPHGEWKHTITWQPYCSNCEYVFGEDEEYSPLWKFCPMCGAEMADNSLFNDITESSNDAVESQNDVIEVVRGERKEQLPQYAEWKDAFDNLKVVKK